LKWKEAAGGDESRCRGKLMEQLRQRPEAAEVRPGQQRRNRRHQAEEPTPWQDARPSTRRNSRLQ
jgi:hypothetical protein